MRAPKWVTRPPRHFMAQRSLFVRLTPPKKKSFVGSREETPLNAKEAVAVAAPAQRVSKRLVAHKEQSDVVRKRIISTFFQHRKANHGKKQSPVVALNKVRMQRDRVLQELLESSNSKSLNRLLARTNTRVKTLQKKAGNTEKVTAQHVS